MIKREAPSISSEVVHIRSGEVAIVIVFGASDRL